MQDLTIYHNPRCSKSRQALELIKQQGIEPHVVDYIKTPLSLEQIKALSQHFDLKDFVRKSEPDFKARQLSLDDEKTLLEAMVTAPKLMQRPIITYQNQAIIARPPEKVLAFLNHLI